MKLSNYKAQTLIAVTADFFKTQYAEVAMYFREAYYVFDEILCCLTEDRICCCTVRM